MAVFDPTLPFAKYQGEEKIDIKVKNYKARTKHKWTVGTGVYYSIEVELELEKCVKKFLGFCIKKEKYKKWFEIPLKFYTSNFYPEFWPINYIEKENLNKEFILDLPEIKSESEAESFFEQIVKNHKNIIKEIK